MALDDRIEHTLDTLNARLQEEIARQVRAAAQDLARAARADQAEQIEHAQQAVQSAYAAALEEAAAAAAAQAPPPPAPPAGSGATTRLAEAVRDIGAARSLTDALEGLVSAASRDAARCAILLVRGDRFEGWRFAGFAALDADARLDIAHADAGAIADAVRTGGMVSTGRGEAASPAFAQLPAGRRCAAFPIVLGDDPVAVFYADEGVDADAGDLDLEFLDVLVRHTSRCLESLTAMKAARWLASSASSSSTAGPARGRPDDEAARRYARLLVSEIKLYHEPQVAAGIRERDLLTRLGGEIARARALYDERIPREIRDRTDYIHEELIRTLAGGDASALEGSA